MKGTQLLLIKWPVRNSMTMSCRFYLLSLNHSLLTLLSLSESGGTRSVSMHPCGISSRKLPWHMSHPTHHRGWMPVLCELSQDSIHASLPVLSTLQWIHTCLSHGDVSFPKERTIAFTFFYCLHPIQSWTQSVIAQGEEVEGRAKMIKEVKWK